MAYAVGQVFDRRIHRVGFGCHERDTADIMALQELELVLGPPGNGIHQHDRSGRAGQSRGHHRIVPTAPGDRHDLVDTAAGQTAVRPCNLERGPIPIITGEADDAGLCALCGRWNHGRGGHCRGGPVPGASTFRPRPMSLVEGTVASSTDKSGAGESS